MAQRKGQESPEHHQTFDEAEAVQTPRLTCVINLSNGNRVESRLNPDAKEFYPTYLRSRDIFQMHNDLRQPFPYLLREGNSTPNVLSLRFETDNRLIFNSINSGQGPRPVMMLNLGGADSPKEDTEKVDKIANAKSGNRNDSFSTLREQNVVGIHINEMQQSTPHQSEEQIAARERVLLGEISDMVLGEKIPRHSNRAMSESHLIAGEKETLMEISDVKRGQRVEQHIEEMRRQSYQDLTPDESCEMLAAAASDFMKWSEGSETNELSSVDTLTEIVGDAVSSCKVDPNNDERDAEDYDMQINRLSESQTLITAETVDLLDVKVPPTTPTEEYDCLEQAHEVSLDELSTAVSACGGGAIPKTTADPTKKKDDNRNIKKTLSKIVSGQKKKATASNKPPNNTPTSPVSSSSDKPMKSTSKSAFSGLVSRTKRFSESLHNLSNSLKSKTETPKTVSKPARVVPRSTATGAKNPATITKNATNVKNPPTIAKNPTCLARNPTSVSRTSPERSLSGSKRTTKLRSQSSTTSSKPAGAARTTTSTTTSKSVTVSNKAITSKITTAKPATILKPSTMSITSSQSNDSNAIHNPKIPPRSTVASALRRSEAHKRQNLF